MDTLSIALAVALGFAVFAFGVLVGSLVSSSRQRKQAAVASMQTAMQPPSPTITVPSDETPAIAGVSEVADTGGLHAMAPPDASTRVAGAVDSAVPVPSVELPGYQLSSEPLAGVDSLLPSVAEMSFETDATAEATSALTVPSIVGEFALPVLEDETIAEPEQSSTPASEIAWDFAAEPEFELDSEVASALEQPFESPVTTESEQSSTEAPGIVWEIGPEPELAPALESATSPISDFTWELPAESPEGAEPDTTEPAPESGLTWVAESEPPLPPVFESPEPTPAAEPESELAWLLEPEMPVEPEPATVVEPEPATVAEPEPAASAEAELSASFGFEPATAVESEPAVMVEPGSAPDWPMVMEPASVQGAVPDMEFAWTPPHTEAPETELVPAFSAPVGEAMEPASLPARPRAHVRAIPEGPAGSTTLGDRSVPREAPSTPPARTENLDMVAPVQMWFGDYAVAVKAGSKTHAQFRKYADVLLDELKDAGERSR